MTQGSPARDRTSTIFEPSPHQKASVGVVGRAVVDVALVVPLCAGAAYFETPATPESLDFCRRHGERFRADAPMLSAVGESCYEGVLFRSALARRAGSLDVDAMTIAAELEPPRPGRGA